MNNEKHKPRVISPLLFKSGCLYEARKAVESKVSSSQSQRQQQHSTNETIDQPIFKMSASPPPPNSFSYPSSSSSPPTSSSSTSQPRKSRGRPAEDEYPTEPSKRARTAAPELDQDFSSLLSISEPDYSTLQDSELDDMQAGAGGVALEFDGDLNDLIRELERTRAKHERHREGMVACVNKIRELSIILERRCRGASQPPVSMQPSADRRKSVSVPPASIAKTKKPSGSTQGAGTYQLQQPQKSRSIQSTQQAPPPSAAVKQKVSTKLTQRGECIPIATSSVVDTLYNIHTIPKAKVFPRKPRNMIMPNSIAGSDMGEIMVTSAMDGAVYFWDLEKQNLITNIPQSQLYQPWSEDICWVNHNVLAAACSFQAGTPLHHQLSLINVEKLKQSKAALSRGASSVRWSVQQLTQTPHDGNKGSIMCISALGHSERGFSLATAGVDKQVFHWQFESPHVEQEYLSTRQLLVHNRHTAMIQAMCFVPESNILYTGGSDCKLFGWDMTRSTMSFENKGQDRINTIDQNPLDPRLILVSRAAMSNQLSLYDSRSGFNMPVLQIGVDGTDRLTRQVKPSWHPDGGLVSCGMQSGSKIHIWDIRWVDVTRGTGQSLNPHGKQVLKAAFHPTRSLMASMSSDCGLAFTNFQLNEGTVVHGENSFSTWR
ncbi:hypothetical protein BGZ46_001354 [Entomortierella lignicola]|nr:hypothetical protein BGZ46_001354 [Entomortierella lignicola]